jgi:hypothetical protein
MELFSARDEWPRSERCLSTSAERFALRRTDRYPPRRELCGSFVLGLWRIPRRATAGKFEVRFALFSWFLCHLPEDIDLQQDFSDV